MLSEVFYKIVKQTIYITQIMLFHAFSQNEELQSYLIRNHRLGKERCQKNQIVTKIKKKTRSRLFEARISKIVKQTIC